jgi:hypothetical protein
LTLIIKINGCAGSVRPTTLMIHDFIRGWGAPQALTVICLAAITVPLQADATVFYARDEIKSLAFPDADTVEPHDHFLTAHQHQQIESRARSAIDSDLVTVYVGTRDGEVLGYAYLDTHTVRTLPETFLIVLTPDGAVASTHLMAFYEPLEYLPADRWLNQLAGRRLTDDLLVGRAIAGITGSTLSSHAVVHGIRRTLALHEVLHGDAHASAWVADETSGDTETAR